MERSLYGQNRQLCLTHGKVKISYITLSYVEVGEFRKVHAPVLVGT